MFELLTALIQPNGTLGFIRFSWVGGVRDVCQILSNVKKNPVIDGWYAALKMTNYFFAPSAIPK
jgi:hypothetical protein